MVPVTAAVMVPTTVVMAAAMMVVAPMAAAMMVVAPMVAAVVVDLDMGLPICVAKVETAPVRQALGLTRFHRTICRFTMKMSASASSTDDIDEYDCAMGTDEAQPEVIYTFTTSHDGTFRAALSDGTGVDIDIHLLPESDHLQWGGLWVHRSGPRRAGGRGTVSGHLLCDCRFMGFGQHRLRWGIQNWPLNGLRMKHGPRCRSPRV